MKRKSNPVDPMGNAVNALSAAFSALNTVSNTIQSMNYYTTPTWTSSGGSIISGTSSTTPFTISGTTSYSAPSTLPSMYDTYTGYPRVDIREIDATHYKVEIFAAGVPKNDIEVDLQEGNWAGNVFYPAQITIRIAKGEQQATDAEKYIVKESKHSATTRVLALPVDVDTEHVSQPTHGNGVLSFTIRRLPDNGMTAQPSSRKIQ